MAATILIPMALMVTSQIVSWIFVLKSVATSGGITALYGTIWPISIFYCGWALYKRIFLGDENDLGHISFGMLAVASYFERKWFTIAANIVLLANFGLALIIIVSYDPQSLAILVKNEEGPLGIAWACTFDVYILSSIGLWSFVLYKLVKQLPSSQYASVPTTRPLF